MLRKTILLLVLLCGCRASDDEIEDVRLMDFIQPGQTVADIGAGDGEFSVFFAKQLGPSGQLYATELDAEKREAIKARATEEGLNNITVRAASAVATNLPEECCDVIFMRRVYHHLTDAPALNRSIYKSLKPFGYFIIIDYEERSSWRSLLPGSDGERHGIAVERVIAELEEAGFFIQHREDNWPHDSYLIGAGIPAGY